MSQKSRQLEAGRGKLGNLLVFPLDQDAIHRLAKCIVPEELRQSRIEKAASIILLLEALLKDLEKMESQALNLSPPPAKLLAEVMIMRKGAAELNRILEDAFRDV